MDWHAGMYAAVGEKRVGAGEAAMGAYTSAQGSNAQITHVTGRHEPQVLHAQVHTAAAPQDSSGVLSTPTAASAGNIGKISPTSTPAVSMQPSPVPIHIATPNQNPNPNRAPERLVLAVDIDEVSILP